MKIIGITGHPGSGKDTIADYFIAKGFHKISGGDILREEMSKLGIPADKRSRIHEFVAEMRKRYGNGYPSEETIKRINGNTVISGIRNTEEVKIFRERLGSDFKLIAVQAPLELRYERAKKRGRIDDDITIQNFKAEEDKERANDSGSHEVDLVIEMADFKIINDGSKEELFKALDKIS
ncbi:AAA family ATPase [Candidatus Wolfebacteria bacterium]|nr:AAA family ATPase [Candidatus Wolfebacteria bacterium]